MAPSFYLIPCPIFAIQKWNPNVKKDPGTGKSDRAGNLVSFLILRMWKGHIPAKIDCRSFLGIYIRAQYVCRLFECSNFFAVLRRVAH
jgi:hypothetical protein